MRIKFNLSAYPDMTASHHNICVVCEPLQTDVNGESMLSAATRSTTWIALKIMSLNEVHALIGRLVKYPPHMRIEQASGGSVSKADVRGC